MTKPIFTVGVPGYLGQKGFKDYENILNNKFEDYHVLLYTHNDNDNNLKFDCFYEKDFSKVKYEELKQIIKDQMNLNK